MSADEINEYIKKLTIEYNNLLNPSPEETMIYSIQLSVLIYALSQKHEVNN